MTGYFAARPMALLADDKMTRFVRCKHDGRGQCNIDLIDSCKILQNE